MTAAERDAHVAQARALFNAGQFWQAHEVLETVWRSIIKSESRGSAEARVWQGFIQAAAALLHRERGNRHGVETVGGAALDKLSGPQHPNVELDMVQFRAQLARALTGKGDPPHLEYRTDG